MACHQQAQLKMAIPNVVGLGSPDGLAGGLNVLFCLPGDERRQSSSREVVASSDVRLDPLQRILTRSHEDRGECVL
jgi:hypothetical protein